MWQTDRRTDGVAVASRALAMRALRRARCNEVSKGAGRCWSYLVQVLRGAGETGCGFKSDCSTWFTRGGRVTSCRAGQPLSTRRRSLLHSVRRQTLDADCRLCRTRPGLGRYHCTSTSGQSNLTLECGPMHNVMVALPNIGGALCSTPHSLTDAHY